MPAREVPCVELGSAPDSTSVGPSPPSSEISSASSPEPQSIRATPMFRALALTPPEPEQPHGQEELERRLPGYCRIVIPRELTLIELLKQCSGATMDEEVLRIRDAKLRVVAERVGLRRLNVLCPRLRSLTLDGSAITSLRDLGIGLNCLKILSINRCGLTSLDGVWGLSGLRELYAIGNDIKDLFPLSALQKLHTLDLSDNPIADVNRVWTLAVCSSLRRLTMKGTGASEMAQYRTKVASALPMLVYLDDQPLHMDVAYDSEGVFGLGSSSSEESIVDDEKSNSIDASVEPGPSNIPENSTGLFKVPVCVIKIKGKGEVNLSKTFDDGFLFDKFNEDHGCVAPNKLNAAGDTNVVGKYDINSSVPLRRRPATTECVGSRPRLTLKPRPRTAVERPTMEARSRLQIVNTLMDKEWRCSGSKLTSEVTVCGNLAQALRRTSTANRRHLGATSSDTNKEVMNHLLGDLRKSLADEIPRFPRLEDWAKFKAETGIDININFDERPRDIDPIEAIKRLEEIEKETVERLKAEAMMYSKVGAQDSCSGTTENEKVSNVTTDSEDQMQRRLFEFFNKQDADDNNDDI